VSGLLLSAAEASGDLLGGELASAIKAQAPTLRLRGLAGPAMRAAGVEAIGETEELGVMGVAEVLSELPKLRAARRSLVEALAEKPQALVVIDAPDFNIPLARKARAAGIPVVFYGSPQVWAWRAGRARELAALGQVLCLLPFEPELYRAHGGRADFVGHPARDRFEPSTPGSDWALLPGSRRAEIQRLLPPMLEAARLLREAVPGAHIRLPLAPGLDRGLLESCAGAVGLEGVEVVSTVAEAAAPAAACLVASGTVTLELACLGRPMVVVYRVHPLTWTLGKLLVRGVEHVALPNVLLGKEAVPEFLQHWESQALCEAWREAAVGEQAAALARVRTLLGEPGAAQRAAEQVLAGLTR